MGRAGQAAPAGAWVHNLRVDLPYGHGSGNHGNHDHGEADHAGVVTGLGDANGGVKDDGGAVGLQVMESDTL